MSETRAATGFRKESDASDLSSPPRPILDVESDAFARRLKEVVGDKKVVWFAKECRLPESNIRSYLNGKFPSIDKAAAIAEAAGVTLDWLASGRQPKTRAELKAAARPQDAGRLDTYRIAVEAVQAWQLENQRFLTPEKLREVLDLLVDLAEDKPEQIKPLTAKVLRLAA